MIDSRRSDISSAFLGITGASGIVIALRLAEVLKSLGLQIISVYTSNALLVVENECVSRRWFLDTLGKYSNEVYSEEDLEAPYSSSSNVLDAYIVVPASIKTLAMVINGIAVNLIVRAILNGLRMRRPVVAVVREAPLGEIELRVLYNAARIGIIVIPAVVGFYTYPQNIRDIVDFIVGKVLDVLGIKHNLYRRWKKGRDVSTKDPCQVLYGLEEI